MAKSVEEQQKEAWLKYFQNIEKENDIIRLLLKYFKEIESEINQINTQNSKKQNDEDYKSDKNNDEKKKEKEQSISDNTEKIEIPSIIPKYVKYINQKELRQYLSKANKKIQEFQVEINKPEISISKKIRQHLEYFNKLYESLNKIHEETENKKPKIDNNKFTSLYLENFKGFSEKNNKEENTINIKPITLIYGPNSFGKSSILQSLLLLHQTAREGEDYRNITLLPNGNFVKLGSFTDFINKKDKNKELKIEFSLPFNHYSSTKNGIKQETSILTKLYFCYYFKLKEEKDIKTLLSQIDISGKQIDYSNTKKPINISKKLLYTLNYNQKSDLYEVISYVEGSSKEIILGNIDKKDTLKKLSFFRLEDFLAESPFEQIEGIIKNLVYLSSFRVPPERYYVPENNTRIYVGKNGEYTAEILSYDKKVDKNVNDWLKKIAGYKLSEKAQGNEKVNSINLNDQETNLNEINLIDLGSGIAQVLPIITQAFKSENDMILIEEPEIHLHPKAQAQLGEMFKEAVKERKNTFIIETHSENLLLRLQKLVRHGELSKDDISIIYVDKTKDKGSYCIPLKLDDEGDIENINEVPNGFFEEGFDELFDITKE